MLVSSTGIVVGIVTHLMSSFLFKMEGACGGQEGEIGREWPQGRLGRQHRPDDACRDLDDPDLLSDLVQALRSRRAVVVLCTDHHSGYLVRSAHRLRHGILRIRQLHARVGDCTQPDPVRGHGHHLRLGARLHVVHHPRAMPGDHRPRRPQKKQPCAA